MEYEGRWSIGMLSCCAHTLLSSRTSLSSNNIDSEAACELAETLRTNTTLTKLE